ncbi:MAG TPA: hypothetical protein VEC99_11230 [Clostridia bacterium]|nr:hypothetical protein [Clostridia bacterium]
MISGRNHHRYFVYAHSRMVGEELAATTNSPHLVQIGSSLQKRLSEFLLPPAKLSLVLIGDEPPPIGDGAACSRVVLSNAAGKRLGIRLRQDTEPEKFHILGFWSIIEPGGSANRSQPVDSETNRTSSAAGSAR